MEAKSWQRKSRWLAGYFELVVPMVFMLYAYGLFHATCEGSCSWAQFAEEIFRRGGKNTRVKTITTEEFGAPAPRPAYSILENYMFKLTTDFKFADWHDAFNEYMETLLA